MERRYGLGVDTGGTFTDAVILDLADYSLIAKAKSPTTHEDLSIGLYESVRKVFEKCDIKPSDITMAGISTTLATNSVLEGHGGDVGLIFIGWDSNGPVSFGEKNQAVIRGGYDSKGKLVAELDPEEAEEAILRVSKGVDALAISGLFAVINPSQERMVKDMAIRLTGLPTVAGTELSSSLGVDERARTAVLNGRLVPIVKRFFDGLERVFGGMLDNGATSFWEGYSAEESGDDRYGFYGRKWAKSLCHAWSAWPAFVFASEALGIRPTSDGWREYVVSPMPGTEGMKATVPTLFGQIVVTVGSDAVSVVGNGGTGTLIWRGRTATVPANGKADLSN